MSEAKKEEAGLPEYPPPANFRLFLEGMIGQAWAALGKFPHPQTGETRTDLPWARYFIDLLGLIEEKTRGHLEEEERLLLEGMLGSLRLSFAQVKDEGEAPSEGEGKAED